MSIIKFDHKGNFNKIERFFNRVLRMDYLNILEKYGERGVRELQAATPVDSGETANSWSYGIEKGDGTVTIYWTNSNENHGVNIAILLIYGHGLQNGGYVVGNDFVTPALEPIFIAMANESWKEVTRR
jgi:hypothetical protein